MIKEMKTDSHASLEAANDSWHRMYHIKCALCSSYYTASRLPKGGLGSYIIFSTKQAYPCLTSARRLSAYGSAFPSSPGNMQGITAYARKASRTLTWSNPSFARSTCAFCWLRQHNKRYWSTCCASTNVLCRLLRSGRLNPWLAVRIPGADMTCCIYSQ